MASLAIPGCSLFGGDDKEEEQADRSAIAASTCTERPSDELSGVLAIRGLGFAALDEGQVAGAAAALQSLAGEDRAVAEELSHAGDAQWDGAVARLATEIDRSAEIADGIDDAEGLRVALVQAVRVNALGNDLAEAFDVPECIDALGFLGAIDPPAPEPVAPLESCFQDATFLQSLPPVEVDVESSEDRDPIEVSCDDSHDFQTIALFEFPGGGGPFPGEVPLSTYGVRLCADRLASLIDGPVVLSEYDFSVTLPTAESWEVGQQMLRCDVHAADRTPMVSPVS